MIHKIYSDLPSFKTVHLHSGLNLILAEKGHGSSAGRTRNGAGKSSLVELLNAFYGSELRKESVLRAKELLHHRFGMELDLFGERVRVEREGASAGKVYFSKRIPTKLLGAALDDSLSMSVDDWRLVLGRHLFGLLEEYSAAKHNPSFRMLVPYFMRSPSGFERPEKYFPQQSTCSVQIAMSYLLKLDWQIARNFEGVRHKEKVLSILREAAAEGTLGSILGTGPELRTQIHVLTNRVEKLRKAASEFRVLPEYEEREARATEIAAELAQLSGQDVTDKEWMGQLEAILASEAELDLSKVERLFSEAATSLGNVVVRRFDEVVRFHESVIRNRREHVGNQLHDIQVRIARRQEQKSKLDQEKSEIMQLLQTHGALEQYISIQRSLARLEADLEQLRKKREVTEELENTQTDLKIERENLLRAMRIDHGERQEAIGEAVVAFAELSGELYEDAGRFVVEPTRNGPSFEFDIPGKKSTGKRKMQIFCLDMVLMRLWAFEANRPTLLVHDSIMFDGVDERQIAKALMIGARMAETYGFQYVVTMNSDDMPRQHNFVDFDIERYRVPLDIDDTPNGGLFGLRFQTG